MNEAHSTEAELSVLGSLLVDSGTVAPQLVDRLSAGEFYNEVYGRLYSLLMEMAARGRKIDLVSVMEYCKGKLDMPPADLKKLILSAAEFVPTVANTRAYAEIVRKNGRARRLQQAVAGANLGAVSAENVDGTIDQLMAKLYDIVSQNPQKNGLHSFKELVPAYYTGLFDRRANENIQTGYTDLDALLKGMSRGNLILLAARPAVGKSALALNIAQNVAKSGKKVAVFSCEMERDELLERAVAAQSGTDMDDLINPEKIRDSQETIGRIASAADTLYKLPVYICDDAAVTVSAIRAQCRMVKGLGLIVVDYLQLLKSTRRSESRNAEVGAISRDLKLLANDLKVPVLALSQLSRETENRKGGQPVLADLRDSGELEQNANKVMLMWEVDSTQHIIAVNVAKNRRGKKGIVQFKFDGAHMRHYPLVKSEYVKIGRNSRNPFE